MLKSSVQRLNTEAMPHHTRETYLDYELLCQLEVHDGASQRDLAARLGVSVGKINYCLRAVIDKGWVKANNFRRADNKWAYAYLLTPGGLRAKLQLAHSFLERKEVEFIQLQAEIAALRHAIDSRDSKGEENSLRSPRD